MMHDLIMKISFMGMIICIWFLYLINGGAT